MKLMESFSNCDSGAGPSSCKSIRQSLHKEVGVALLQWFNQKQAEGTSVFDPLYAQKAEFFHKALGLEGEFIASIGWLTRFKQSMVLMKML
jgi:hypothetical protein